jgi:quercetin dioxygenase-like cupin family protein
MRAENGRRRDGWVEKCSLSAPTRDNITAHVSAKEDVMSSYGKAVVLGPGEGHEFTIGADRVLTKGMTEHDGDGFSVVEYHGAANNPGPPPHVHRTSEECWFILDGQVDFTVEGQVVRGQAGSFFLVPRGIAHTFQVVGSTPARWIGIFSPARYVGLIEELGQLIPLDGPPDLAKVVALFARYDTEIVSVPGTS